ncbi:hypothetical protein VNO78_09535 [Psophocarpus tetragonolobus]|uniref:Uncharacterized protein n=1 Tax=Psophocarpus tetragonolobus TaxID=3891 RepID=A0AAN9SXM5_PSOTE
MSLALIKTSVGIAVKKEETKGERQSEERDEMLSWQSEMVFGEGVAGVGRYQATPKESHMNAVKRILKYLKGTMDVGLRYLKGWQSITYKS